MRSTYTTPRKSQVWLRPLLILLSNTRNKARNEEGGRRLRTHPASLHLLGGHDDDVRVLLVEHLPEVHHRVLQAALRGDEDFALVGISALFVHTLAKTENLKKKKVI